MSRTPLFQALLTLVDVTGRSNEMNDLRLRRSIGLGTGTTKTDLVLLVEDNGDGISGVMEYSTDLFEADTISRMVGHFSELLEGIATHPDRPIDYLPVLTAAERRSIVEEWNSTSADFGNEMRLDRLFEEQAKRTPDHVALVFEGSRLTYSELDDRANRLASRLCRLGVGPDVLVGILAERSFEMVIAIYAILKAGGAYVPLDPSYPESRLESMLSQAKTPVVLSQKRLLEKLPTGCGQVLVLDPDQEDESDADLGGAAGAPDNGAAPENLAYVIFTSGSTGEPKGVMNSHRAICNRLIWMQEKYGLRPGDTVLQKTPFSFDVSVWEFFWPLITGARLIIARPDGHRDSDYLVDLIRREGITTLHFVPSMLQIFLENRNVSNCRSLKRVICSGEALTLDMQERFFQLLGSCQLHNLYGPTEAAVDVTYWHCRPDADRRRSVPIGRPISNIQIYLLDESQTPVPIGVAGELHIGGVGLARGYAGKPGLTAERFVPDPFSKTPGDRLYKTGDLCRYAPDGAIEYIGRNDFQVKIRGNRIELGEIESVLGQHDRISELVVVAREDSPGDKELVAYYATSDDSPIDVSELRRMILDRLADYMAPSTFVRLSSFPLTTSGKLDRRALPPPEKRREPGQAYQAPQTAIEKQIAQVWKEVLQLEKVGVDDNFFDLGGHSLLLAKVQNRLAGNLTRDLSMMDLFQFPTVSALARYLLSPDSGESAPSDDFRERARMQQANLAAQQRAALERRKGHG